MESIIINVYVIIPVHKVLHFKQVPNNDRENLEKVVSFLLAGASSHKANILCTRHLIAE